MKTDKPLRPVVITSHPANIVLGTFMLLSAPFMLWIGFTDGRPSTVTLCALMAALGMMLGLALLIGPRLTRITVSTEGVVIEQPRKGLCEELPWENYRFAYRLSGYKVSYLLFSPDALSRQAQYEAVNACSQSKEIPCVHGGCLALPDHLYYPQIMKRLPESIRVMPEHECGTLWNKGRG